MSEWVIFIKNIPDTCGYSNIWLVQTDFSTKWLNDGLKQKLFDQFQQIWRSDVCNSSKGLSYRLYKDVKFEFRKICYTY